MTGNYGPQRQPVGWVYLPDGYTIRWERFDRVAYIFPGNRVKTTPPDGTPRVPVLATVPVPPSGWSDMNHIQVVGRQWLASRAGTPARPSGGRLAETLKRLLKSNPTDEEIVQVVSSITNTNR
ncbi:MAG: hypothetical protein ACRDT0_09730 [Pseudonocardiaceae bacterium]